MPESTQYNEIDSFIHEFFDIFYTRRSFEKLSPYIADNIIFIGLNPKEVCFDKESFLRVSKAQMDFVTEPVQYRISEYHQTKNADGLWSVFASVRLSLTCGDFGSVQYVIRVSATVQKTDGIWKITTLHCSEPTSYSQEEQEALHANEVTTESARHPITQYQLGFVMDEMIPGGIVVRFPDEACTIAVANKQFLSMVGYFSFQEFKQVSQDSYLASIHPDDVSSFLYTVKFVKATGNQSLSEYRIRRKDGTYFWAQDISCTAKSPEGKPVMVSVITDMSEQVERRHRLENASGIDFLTQVYNRQGALEKISHLGGHFDRFLFAMIDLDNFKCVNDLYGHILGDEVLKKAAQLLKEHFSTKGIVCRMGGDEFSVLLPDYDSLVETQKIFRDISREFSEYAGILCPKACTALSVGGVYGTKYRDPDHMYQEADQNLYIIKQNGKNDILFSRYTL